MVIINSAVCKKFCFGVGLLIRDRSRLPLQFVKGLDCLWNGIVAAGAERMTSGYALQPQPTTFDQPIPLHSFERVLAATGRVAAGGRHPGKSPLVATDQEDSNSAAHLWFTFAKTVLTSSSMLSKLAFSASTFTTTT
jgi:hypothetical protein